MTSKLKTLRQYGEERLDDRDETAALRDAHLRLIPHVPLCGWDVALTANDGMLLLEGNFSCNFFRGDFDQKAYFEFVSDYFVDLERRRADGTAL